MDLFTIGYEGAALADFLATLRQAGVCQVIDIRELPQSRRAGFSKNVLAAHLEGAGIDYLHVKQLGDPKHGRDAAKAGRMDEFRQIFEAHMELPASQAAVKQVASVAREKTSVLLCYERDPKFCHRSIVANHILALADGKVRHLGVQAIASQRSKPTEAGDARHA